MNFSYNPLLVVLSVLVAVQASYVGLSLAMHISGAFALNRRLLIAGSAFSLAVGIWSMHFIGMLAIKTAFNLDYDVLLTLISFLVCVLVTGAAIYLASLRARRMLVIAAIVMGLGISAMHYIGMAAVHGSAHMSHDPAYIVVSIAIAIAASGLALWLAFAAQARPSLLLCAGVLGCAISGMHYVAMAGTELHAMQGMSAAGPAISTGLLAVIVSVVAFSVSGLFMLTLIPDTQDEREVETGNKTDAKAPAPARATQSPVLPQEPQPQTAGQDLAAVTIMLPVEKQGNRFHIEVAQIVSVHANAHYTYLFNGREDLFCQLSMTDIVARLPRPNFFRTHRSYVVNLEHVIQVRKAADAGIAELDTPIRRTVPVSRSRVAMLRQELAQFQATRAEILS